MQCLQMIYRCLDLRLYFILNQRLRDFEWRTIKKNQTVSVEEIV